LHLTYPSDCSVSTYYVRNWYYHCKDGEPWTHVYVWIMAANFGIQFSMPYKEIDSYSYDA